MAYDTDAVAETARHAGAATEHDARSEQAGGVGHVLEAARLITSEQSAQIFAFAQSHGRPFGDAAVELGVIDRDTLDRAVAEQIGHPGETWSGEPVAFTQPNSPQAEDYRSIRNALALRWFKHPKGERTLAVVSADRGEGRSLMAANLAAGFAQVGFNTLLVDGDMRHPRQHEIFAISPALPGLSALLSGNQGAQGLVHILPAMPTLSILTAGGIPSNPQELLLRETLGQFIDHVRLRYDMIIVDTPAASVGSDYQIIGSATRGALLVTHASTTRSLRARQVVDQCHSFGIPVVGSAMLGV
ncbi:polysaccharide biosynthesis tyrosine autokinase [Novosphingobium sp.]|uniref:polysaccharide biosynthesis tyrosine autokinase n=1 Tax=Novosphingobium sp. TaxID=1874826 RepID=UPI00333E87FE